MVICPWFLGFLIEFAIYLLVRQMPVLFYIRPYLVLSINFLAVTSPFVNDLLLTHNPSEGFGYSLSFVLICCKVLVPFLFLFFFFFFCVDSSVTWIRQAGSCHLHLLKDCACVNGLHPSRQGLVTWLIPIQGMFVAFMTSSVTYIRQSGILSLSHFLVTYIHLRNLAT